MKLASSQPSTKSRIAAELQQWQVNFQRCDTNNDPLKHEPLTKTST